MYNYFSVCIFCNKTRKSTLKKTCFNFETKHCEIFYLKFNYNSLNQHSNDAKTFKANKKLYRKKYFFLFLK